MKAFILATLATAALVATASAESPKRATVLMHGASCNLQCPVVGITLKWPTGQTSKSSVFGIRIGEPAPLAVTKGGYIFLRASNYAALSAWDVYEQVDVYAAP